MNCEQVTRAAGDFVERRLGLGERIGIMIHVAMCRGCRAFIDQFRLTMLGLRSLPQPAAAAPSQELLERLRKQSEARAE